jgi:DNA-binding IclR family transcriptional regulator
MGRKRIPSAGFATDETPSEDPRFVTALARGLALLRCFSSGDRWVKHQELVRRSGLPQATVSRLSFTLTALGYLHHRAMTGEYALSPAILALGFSVLTNFDVGRIAKPFMDALARHTQAGIALGIRHDISMIYVTHSRGTARLVLGLDVGSRVPLAITAMGRAMWCCASPALREMLSRDIKADSPADWPLLEAGLISAQREYAERGYASSESEWESDVAAVGVGIDIGDGREPLALTAGGPASRLTSALLHEDYGPALVRTGKEIVAAVRSADWTDGRY